MGRSSSRAGSSSRPRSRSGGPGFAVTSRARRRLVEREPQMTDRVGKVIANERSQEMGLRHYLAASAALVTVVVLVGAGSAHATIFNRGEFTFEDSAEEEMCG